MILKGATLAVIASTVQADACARGPMIADITTNPVTVTIDPTCLTDPEDTGVVMADLAQTLIAAHLAADPTANEAAVWEVIAETFVHEILDPTRPASN